MSDRNADMLSLEDEVAAGRDLADLFIVGADFYSGSIGKRLKNGWCDFGVLALQQAHKRFGNDWALGKAWYITERVTSGRGQAFEEHKRQDIWLRAQGANVVRVVIGSNQSRGKHPPLVAGQEFSFGTETEAVTAIRGSVLAPAAMMISAGNEQSPLFSFLDEEYRQQHEILLPPESAAEENARQQRLEHSDLEAATLSGPRNDELWQSYLRSINEKKVVAGWLDKISDSEERRLLYQFLHERLPRSPKNFLTHAQADPAITAKAVKRIGRYLDAHGKVDNSLARDERCIEFIAGSLIKIVAGDLRQELRGPDPKRRPTILSGRELIAQAARLYPKVEICESAERQIREMKGNERYFDWVLNALGAANREMSAWSGGEFPHHRLPGPASPESAQTMNKNGDKRLFRMRNGQMRFFQHHMKYIGENMRVHYLVDPKRSRLIIGYVGPHLPTVLHAT